MKPHHQVKSEEALCKFLDCLAETANVSAAARSIGISRALAYIWKAEPGLATFWRLSYEESEPRLFADCWAEALEEAADELEHEALRWAKGQLREPVVFQGQVQYQMRPVTVKVGEHELPQYEQGERGKVEVMYEYVLDDNGNPIPLTIPSRNPRMMEILLKAHRPERFRENINLKAQVTGGVLVVPGSASEVDWETAASERAEKMAENLGVPLATPPKPKPRPEDPCS